ncbi:hypothetical protein R5H30_05525 [Sulfitobacter sp. D35]|uniref:hypothetical protein n=1 Tax=Sulfitobacter sp. D35 TaxID=3083252 RepID=UPI00296FF889|nr:hypothetical protein [Sulfitobacter sp. D35]MDW4497433.1 hypothetical protein [Sulfitobacter sp. D35]
MRRLLLCLAVCVAPPVLAAQESAGKVYSGREASALRCANAMAFTAVALDSVGALAPGEKDVMLGVTIRILERHVSGTWEQKKQALAVIRDRHDPQDTLDDFRRYAESCLKEFPIN